MELRIHGVGGTPAPDLLGEQSLADVVRVAGEGKSAFFARLTRPRVEGYAWGPLTAGALVQPLWLFLLPFTLANVAGWMLPSPSHARNRFWWGAARVLVVALGLSLTAAYVLGTSSVVLDLLFLQWGASRGLGTGGWRLVLGTLAVALIGVVVYWVAHTKQGGFEKVLSPILGSDAQGCEGKDANRQGLIDALFREEGDLGDRYFWSRPAAARHLLWIHAGVAVMTYVGFALSLFAAEFNFDLPLIEPNDAIGELFEGAFLVIGTLQAVCMSALVVICVVGFHHPVRLFISRHFRIFGSVVAISTAIGLSAWFFSGVSELVAKALGAGTRIVPHFGRGKADLNFAFGISVIATLLMIALVMLFLWGRARRQERHIRWCDERRHCGESPSECTSDCPPINRAPAGQEPDGIPSSRVGELTFRRATSDLLRQLDLVLTLPAIVFAPLALAFLLELANKQLTIPVLEWKVPALEEVAATALPGWGVVLVVSVLLLAYILAACGALPKAIPLLLAGTAVGSLVGIATTDWTFNLTAVSGVGTWTATTGLGLLLVFLWRGYFKAGQRETIGILWDVLTFWPRRFHPLAVRPYAERAVPELQGRICYHVRQEGRRLLVSAHSQGSVLAFAALTQIAQCQCERWGTKLTADISLLTYGSPLTQLHSCYFPGYFSADAHAALERQLFASDDVHHRERSFPTSWHSCYRLTDYIGKEVRIGNELDRFNERLHDPPPEPLTSKQPVNEPFEDVPDPSRSPWVELSLHSYYNREPALKQWIDKVKRSLETSR